MHTDDDNDVALKVFVFEKDLMSSWINGGAAARAPEVKSAAATLSFHLQEP